MSIENRNFNITTKIVSRHLISVRAMKLRVVNFEIFVKISISYKSSLYETFNGSNDRDLHQIIFRHAFRYVSNLPMSNSITASCPSQRTSLSEFPPSIRWHSHQAQGTPRSTFGDQAYNIVWIIITFFKVYYNIPVLKWQIENERLIKKWLFHIFNMDL